MALKYVFLHEEIRIKLQPILTMSYGNKKEEWSGAEDESRHSEEDCTAQQELYHHHDPG